MTTTEEITPAVTETIAYHWIMTLQCSKGGYLTANTVSGSANLVSGYSRSAAYLGVMDEAKHMTGFTDPVAVLFFSLEKDEL